MRTATIVALAFAVIATAIPALADEQADGTVQPVLSNGQFQYNITLQNTGTTDLGSFWFSWVPGIDFLPTAPDSVQSPAGWTAYVINNPYFDGDGYSIQWVANTPLPAGQSLPGFSFTSQDDPSVMAGNSPIYFGYYPTTISYAYTGAPEVGAATVFFPTVLATVAAAPEPTTLSLAGLGIASLLLKRRAGNP